MSLITPSRLVSYFKPRAHHRTYVFLATHSQSLSTAHTVKASAGGILSWQQQEHSQQLAQPHMHPHTHNLCTHICWGTHTHTKTSVTLLKALWQCGQEEQTKGGWQCTAICFMAHLAVTHTHTQLVHVTQTTHKGRDFRERGARRHLLTEYTSNHQHHRCTHRLETLLCGVSNLVMCVIALVTVR